MSLVIVVVVFDVFICLDLPSCIENLYSPHLVVKYNKNSMEQKTKEKIQWQCMYCLTCVFSCAVIGCQESLRNGLPKLCRMGHG